MLSKARITKESVAAVEDMIDLLKSQNAEFYAEHPEIEVRVEEDQLNELRATLLKHAMEMSRRAVKRLEEK